MANVSIRDLRNNGGEVVERAARGETITITRAGKPVAELRPLPAPRVTAVSLLARSRALPHMDPAALRDDLDKLISAEL